MLAKGGNGQIQAMPWNSAATSSFDEVNVWEWLNITTLNSSTKTHCIDSGEQIVQAVRRPEEKNDDKLIADEPAVPSHGVAYACLSTFTWELKAQANYGSSTSHYNTTARWTMYFLIMI